jgi:putative membrane protein
VGNRLPAPALLAIPGMLAQIVYPLQHGEARDIDTIIVVVLLGCACLAHAYRCGVLGEVATITVLGGFAVEQLGVHTGFPFGDYTYSRSLGVRIGGVPLVIALAWPMMAWPAALVARRLATRLPARVLLGAWALATWDLFLDPQMVSAGHWRWRHPSPHLPGVSHIPLTNYAGWLGVALIMSLGLQLVLQRRDHSARGIPLPLYLWTWAASTLALAAFLHLASAAAWGFSAMGTVAVPLIVSLARAREPR